MTRERAAELLSGVTVLDDPEMEEAHKMAISALWQQEHPQWISVKDRLPGRYETVLIAISTVNGYGDPAKLVTIGGYDHSEKRWEQYTSTDRQLCRGETVTHWMPLPEPTEEGEK